MIPQKYIYIYIYIYTNNRLGKTINTINNNIIKFNKPYVN